MTETTAERLLCVGDSGNFLTFAEKQLKTQGYILDYVACEVDALKRMARGYGAALVAHGHNGVDALRLLKSVTERELTLPLLVLVLPEHDHIMDQVVRLGAADCLIADPGQMNTLSATLSRVLGKEPPSAQPGGDPTFAAVLDGLPSAAYVTDPRDFRLLFLNAAARARYGDRVGELCFRELYAGRTVPCDGCPGPDLIASNGDCGQPRISEEKDGDAVRKCRDQAIPWSDGRLVHLRIAEDITEERRRDEALRRVIRARETLADCNHALVYATSEQQLVAEVCRIIVDTGGFARAWVVLDEEVEGSDQLTRLLSESEGRVLDDGSACAEGRGERRAVFPLVGQGRHLGVLMVTSANAQAFDADDMLMFKELAADLAYGMASQRTLRQHMQAEERLRCIAGRLSQAQRIARLGNWEWDMVTGELWWSEEIYRLFGLDPARFRPDYESFLACVHPEDRALVRQAVNRAMKAATSDVDHRILRPDGEVRVVNWHAETVFDDLGRPSSISGTVHDITERDRAEKERLQGAERLRNALVQTVQTIALTVEKRDPYTAGHQKRVARLAATLAIEMGLSPEIIDGVYMGGLIHDVGKVAIPVEILNKPSKLSDVEFMLVKAHPQAGYEILKDVAFPWPVADMVHQHHERFDGTGYPQGLAGEGIRLEARILHVADVVEAMASHRPYRPAKGIDPALAEIADGAGSRYDPDAAAACLTLFRTKGYQLEKP